MYYLINKPEGYRLILTVVNDVLEDNDILPPPMAALRHLVIGLAVPCIGAVVLRAQSIYATPYTFTTLAGTTSDYGSVDGSGLSARFNRPAGLAVDSVGNVYVADQSNNTIRKVTNSGVVTTLAGLAGSQGSANGTGNAARFDKPQGVAVDTAGNVYVADSNNQTIRKITGNGVVTTLAGLAGTPGSADGTGSTARFNYPEGLAVDGEGNVYVGDYGNHVIRKITSGGAVTTLAGLAGSPGSADGTGSAARLYAPRGVAVDSTGNLYVADAFNHTIRKINSGGAVTTLAGMVLTLGSADGTGSAARFNYPAGVAVDSAGNVYIAEGTNHTVRMITSTGVVTTLAGSAGNAGTTDGLGSAARFNVPYGVAVGGAGSIYLADTGNNAIRWGALGLPVLTSATVASGHPGQNFTYRAIFSGAFSGYGSSGLPAWLSLDAATGVLTGTPTLVGTFLITLKATNGAGIGPAVLTLTVSTAPFITAQPLQHTVYSGSSVVFAAEVAGADLSYQWKKDGVAINGATSSKLLLTQAQASAAGNYTVVVSNAAGSVTSAAAPLTINPEGAGTLPRGVNLSVRTTAGTGDSTLIVGAVVGGAGTTGPKPLLIRAVGPTLSSYGVMGALADPNLEFILQGAATPLATNDNWGGDGQVSSIAQAVGAFPLVSPASRDAALYLTPSGGVFTVKVSGVGGTTGVALAEIYDASGLAYTATSPRFINFSARAQVGTGDGVLIAGFVIEGTAERTMLIRAVGPTLGVYGVGGALLDPQLELTQSVNGATVIVASNDNWGGDAQIASVGGTVGAFALNSAASKDAALLVTLPPGVYSAKASGVGATTGVALIEVYEVP